jgi:hypothetical protein
LLAMPDAAPLLVEIEQHARPALPISARAAQLRAAIAFQAAQHIAGEAGRMQPRKHGFRAVGASDLDCEMLDAAIVGAVDV